MSVSSLGWQLDVAAVGHAGPKFGAAFHDNGALLMS
jgi:hypothetical protein